MTPAARDRARVRTPLLFASAAAWMLLLVHPGGLKLHCHGVRQTSLAGLLARNPLGELSAGWALMLVAMMLPLMTGPICHVRFRSFAHRRTRATGLFLAGYVAFWMAAGVALTLLALLTPSLAENPLMVPLVTTFIVLAWQASPLKQACLNQLHAHRQLSAFGLAADLDALRFGLEHGFWCVGSCWGLMLLPMLFPEVHFAAMGIASVWMWAEQLTRPVPPSWAMRVPAKAIRLVLVHARMRALAR